MSRRPLRVAMTLALTASWYATVANGCSATGSTPTLTAGTGGGTTMATGTGGRMPATGGGDGGSILIDFDAGDASDATDEGLTNPCGSKCGPTELCDPAHLGLDDDCNGLVDEGCPCSPGSVHWCFKGDPFYRGHAGCFDGTETCSEIGVWGPCVGGVHAIAPDNCFVNDTSACHAISAPPYASVHLKTGTGNFSANAVAGSESYTVQCPTGVSKCPAVTSPDGFEALQSGEYTVTYTKSVAGDPNPKACSFPLFVGAPGLRVELSWEHSLADTGVDLDLHVHQPVNTQPWGIGAGQSQDCSWVNCKFASIMTGVSPAPHWWPDTNVLPQPVNWDRDITNPQNNTCYNDPHGVGGDWQAFNMGCHNPRLDVDNAGCNFAITDPNDPNFCTPENINVDYPPDREWFRVGVHYYWNHSQTYAVHPEVKIFCNGALSADLGPQGFYSPSSPVTFEAAAGAGSGMGNRFWLAADVAFSTDKTCGATTCVVQPIYGDPTSKAPLFAQDSAATTAFAPAWPAPPP